MARQKAILINNLSRTDAENAFETYNDFVNKLAEVEDKLHAEIAVVKNMYNNQITQLQTERDKAFEILHTYAAKHPEMFEKRKSVKWMQGAFGYRTGMPKLKARKGFTWTNVLSLIKKTNPLYIRTVEEINKDLLIADREILKEQLKEIGVEITQDETFFVQPKLEAVA